MFWSHYNDYIRTKLLGLNQKRAQCKLYGEVERSHGTALPLVPKSPNRTMSLETPRNVAR